MASCLGRRKFLATLGGAAEKADQEFYHEMVKFVRGGTTKSSLARFG